MKGAQLNFGGDPNIGLYAKSCDDFCLVGNFVSDSTMTKMENVLKTEVFRVTAANTDLIGIFVVLNKNGIIIPRIVSEMEIKKFKELKKEKGINLEILSSRFTAIGNLIVCNDHGALVSRLIPVKDRKKVQDALGAEVEVGKIAKMNIVGSTSLATNKGCLVHRDASEKEVIKISEILKVEADIGTANFGSPFVGGCIIANSNGFITGDSTTGPEITRIMETLGFI